MRGGEDKFVIGYPTISFEKALKKGSFLTCDLFSIIVFKGGINPALNPDSNPIGSFFEDDYLISNPVGSIISTYKCAIVKDFDSGIDDGFTRKCNFDFVHNLKNYPLSEGDIINIRTDRDFH